MKKVTTLFSAVLFAVLGLVNVQAQDALIISEYIEGSSNNKAIELFNTTSDTVSLDSYQIAQSVNGGGWQYYHTFPEGAKIAPFGTWVMATNQVDSALYDTTLANEVLSYPSVVHHNGDDARAIIYISGSDTTLVDVFGNPNADPGSGWDVAGVTNATQNHTLIRKPNITSGNTDTLASFGTNAEDSEWIVLDENDFSDLGNHTFGFEITFQADMNDIIDSAAFVPGEDFITIPGSMNDWSTTADTLTDADDDGIYTKTLTLAPQDYSYKFYIYSNSGRITGGYEANQPTDNTNRNFTVTADSTLDAEMPSFDYRDLNDATFGEVELYFQVDMSIQELNGNFDPETEYVSVTGAFDGWSATSNAMTETQTESVYEVTVTFPTNQAIPSTYAYKFTIVNADESVSWESGDDKLITVTEDGLFEGKYLAQNAPDGNVPYFDNITPSDVFTEDTDVVFEVDLRPAYYTVADSGALPADVQTGTGADSTISWLYGNGPLLANGWEDWGVDSAAAKSAGLFFNDRGVDGDEVAGDSLFSATFSYVAGDARVGAFKMGANGQDNEAGFGADHNVRINDANKIEVVFGGFIRADSVYDDLYDEYILATEEGPVVVRRGGSGDDGVVVSNETETIETPQEFTLSQNYPNPFNPTTNINFTLPQATNVTLTVYNVLGQQVARLVNGRLAAGQHSVQFDASNLASGMYLYRIEAGTFAQNKKMMLIK